jgi:hypothetical protein
MGLGLAGHFMVVRSLPALSALPVPAQVGLAVLPTALIAAQFFLLEERLSARAYRVLSLVAGSLHLGLSLSLPATLVLGAVLGGASPGKALAAVLGSLLLLSPALLFAGLYLSSAVQDWREAPGDTAD